MKTWGLFVRYNGNKAIQVGRQDSAAVGDLAKVTAYLDQWHELMVNLGAQEFTIRQL